MSLQLAQLGKIAYYEFRMHWRERALLVIFLAIAVMNAVTLLIVTTNSIPMGVGAQQTLAIVSAAPISVALAIILPIVVSSTIPKDTQWGVRELVDTLPVSPGIYVAGKVVGMWAGVLAGLAVVATINGILYRLALGSFEIGHYIEMWLVVGVCLVILNGTLGVIIPAAQPNRRRAALLLIGIFVLSFFMSAGSFTNPTILSYLNPMRPAIIMHYTKVLNPNLGVPADSWRDVGLTMIAGLAELVGIAALWWGWSRWSQRS